MRSVWRVLRALGLARVTCALFGALGAPFRRVRCARFGARFVHSVWREVRSVSPVRSVKLGSPWKFKTGAVKRNNLILKSGEICFCIVFCRADRAT